jgi:hypothetical protein
MAAAVVCRNQDVRLQSHAGAVAAVEGSPAMPEWYATAHETQRGEAHWGLHSCTSEEEALGFAVGKLPCGHAVQKVGERVDGELFKRANTAAIEAASVNRRVHQLLTWA